MKGGVWRTSIVVSGSVCLGGWVGGEGKGGGGGGDNHHSTVVLSAVRSVAEPCAIIGMLPTCQTEASRVAGLPASTQHGAV
jgi:hypothetical protein